MDTPESERLRALRAMNVLDTPREERFDRVVRLARALFHVPMAAITLVDEDRQWHKANAGFAREFTEGPRDQSFCHHTIQRSSVMEVKDATNDARFSDNPAVTGDTHVRFYAGQPLHAPDGERIGALCIVDTKPRDLTPDEEEVLVEMARWVEGELSFQRDIAKAAEIQQLLMPNRAPTCEGYDLAGLCLPAQQVGGDFFDWYELDHGLQIHVADVMGKGVGAALIAASVRSMFRGASQFNDQEATINKSGRALEPDLSSVDAFVTVFSARLEPESGRLSYVDAGHGLAGIAGPGGSYRTLKTSGLPLGVLRDAHWRAHETTLAPGESLVIVSDGFLDHFQTVDAAMERAAEAVHAGGSAQVIVQRFRSFASTHAMTDDATVVVLRRELT
ncbi:PP2C family protein-serine/threonine phosphatase [Aestuariimicrobium sp. T2.26MG-19.2B]|uniref:PP2C family protein-serine/threonine phosphatase n=1 Tax=Aestuariimicrobium sp. T2.26MG-19.2B TaxID=3040679 RepID=UPI002477B18F|nr:SpoIIE family protein phosphatase [Aestuariimicrobium sp. T2.26MG-19.2B]CAI9405520.1 hypothetical protein AESSP_01430 [Aestuariimicrobium sp. T2.26MG-19.2B]